MISVAAVTYPAVFEPGITGMREHHEAPPLPRTLPSRSFCMQDAGVHFTMHSPVGTQTTRRTH